jgi:LacI family repressor for deo operon, udp, cdd, tsx, nupC, and nupG
LNVLENITVNPRLDIPLAQQLKQQMVWLIVSGQLKPDETLPSVRRMAKHLAININTVRSAYQKLEMDGMVATRQGLGTRILAYDPGRRPILESSIRSHTVGVILPAFSNPFYYAFLQGIEEEAYNDNTLLFICQTHDDALDALRIYGQLVAKGVDGVIVASHGIDQYPTASIQGSTLPFVSVDWPTSPGYSVLLDLESAGYQATRHLLEHGHRRIGLITYLFDVPNVRPVNEGYYRAMREAGIEPQKRWIAPIHGFDAPAGQEATRMLLSQPDPPTAIFAIADMLALGAMQSIREAGLRIPEDIALASFNDIPLAALVEPQLTTVAAPAQSMGMEAMKMLQCLITGKQPVQRQILLPVSLVVRKSCGEHLH